MTEEREQEVVQGTIAGVTLKREGTWQVEVQPEGSQYTKKLWTKDKELVGALESKLGEAGAFVCNASYWKRQDGQEVRSLWISEEASAEVAEIHKEVGVRFPVGMPMPSGKQPADGMTPEKWDAKERRDYRSRAWAQVLGAFQHTIKTDEDPIAVFNRLQPIQRKVFEDVCQSFAYPGDESDIPFSPGTPDHG